MVAGSIRLWSQERTQCQQFIAPIFIVGSMESAIILHSAVLGLDDMFKDGDCSMSSVMFPFVFDLAHEVLQSFLVK